MRRTLCKVALTCHFFVGCLPLSGLSGSLRLELNLWQNSAASFLTELSGVRQQCEAVCLGLTLTLLSVLLPAAFCRFLPSRIGCNSVDRVVMDVPKTLLNKQKTKTTSAYSVGLQSDHV